MISGLRNPEHQTRLLADVASLESFQDKFDKLMSLEVTDKSTPHLSQNSPAQLPASSAAGAKSDYQKQKSGRGVIHKPKPVEARTSCRGCGKQIHPAGRRKECPAFRHICTNCNRLGHFQSACEHEKTKGPYQPSANNAAQSVEVPSSADAVSSSWVFSVPGDQEPLF